MKFTFKFHTEEQTTKPTKKSSKVLIPYWTWRNVDKNRWEVTLVHCNTFVALNLSFLLYYRPQKHVSIFHPHIDEFYKTWWSYTHFLFINRRPDDPFEM